MNPDWHIYVGENEGNPLLVTLDRSHGQGASDPSRPWAIMVEFTLARVDSNALPPQEDWPSLERIEAALVVTLATDEDDWRYVARIYGEGTARFCFYARRSSAAAERVGRAIAGLEDLPPHRVQVLPDPSWSAYAAFFPAEERERTPLSFRDEPPYAVEDQRPSRPPREEQPWRGEESQAHPDE